jgi:LmbE family N-acetylglucosaminyl deacetylase
VVTQASQGGPSEASTVGGSTVGGSTVGGSTVEGGPVESGPAAGSPIDAPGTGEETWARWTGLGALPVVDITRWRSVVILAAHPDDEVLGAGGMIAALAAAGARLRLVAVTDGEASHPGHTAPGELARRRIAETAAALRVLGAERTEVIRLGLPDTGVATRESHLVARLATLGAGFDVCLAPWEHDAHPDHEAVGRAARRAGPPVLFYPVWMWHWSHPGDTAVPWDQAVQMPLAPGIAAGKRLAIRCFHSQLSPRDGAGPVLSPETIAHFTREAEVFFPVSSE